MLKSLNEIRGLADPVKQYQCEFTISELPGPMLAKLTQQLAGRISGNTAIATVKDLRLRCTSYSYPGTKIAQSELVLGSFKRRIGTVQDRSGVWKCVVTEDFQGSVLNFIQAWCDLINSPLLGTRCPSILYAGTAKLELGGDVINPHNGKRLSKRTIWLRGFYPIGYSVGNINPSSSDPVNVSIDFNYDCYYDNSYSLFAQYDDPEGLTDTVKGIF